MGELANVAGRTRRKSRIPAGFAGKHLVFGELIKRGFEAQLGPRKHELLVRAGDSPPRPIRVKTAHVTPWYDRRANFAGRLANQVTVFVLIGLEGNSRSVRFFVVKNGDLLTHFRQTALWEGVRKLTNKKTHGYIDSKSVEKYEDNWALLE
jgi:hypothetical protein